MSALATEEKRFKEFMNKNPTKAQIIARIKKIAAGKSAKSAMKLQIMKSGLRNYPNGNGNIRKTLSNNMMTQSASKNVAKTANAPTDANKNAAKRAKVLLTKMVNGKRVKKTREELLKNIQNAKSAPTPKPTPKPKPAANTPVTRNNRAAMWAKSINRANYPFINMNTFNNVRKDYVNQLNRYTNTIARAKSRLNNLENNQRAQEGVINALKVNNAIVKKSRNEIVNELNRLEKKRLASMKPNGSSNLISAYKNAKKQYDNVKDKDALLVRTINAPYTSKTLTNAELKYYIKEYKTAVANYTTKLTRAEKKYFSGVDLSGKNDSDYELPSNYDSDDDDAYVDEPDDDTNSNVNGVEYKERERRFMENRIRQRFGVNPTTDRRFKMGVNTKNDYDGVLLVVSRYQGKTLPSLKATMLFKNTQSRGDTPLTMAIRKRDFPVNQKEVARRRAEVIMNNILNRYSGYEPKNITQRERNLFFNIRNRSNNNSKKRVLTDAQVSKVLQKYSKNYKQFLRQQKTN